MFSCRSNRQWMTMQCFMNDGRLRKNLTNLVLSKQTFSSYWPKSWGWRGPCPCCLKLCKPHHPTPTHERERKIMCFRISLKTNEDGRTATLRIEGRLATTLASYNSNVRRSAGPKIKNAWRQEQARRVSKRSTFYVIRKAKRCRVCYETCAKPEHSPTDLAQPLP